MLVRVGPSVAKAGGVFVLNRVGASIWRLLDGRRPVSRLAALVTAEFDVAGERAEADVVRFLSELRRLRLVRELRR